MRKQVDKWYLEMEKKDIYALHQTFCGIISCIENTNQSPFAPWREWGCLAATTNATKTSLCQEGGLIIINISTFFCYNKCLIISHFNSIKVKRLFFLFVLVLWLLPCVDLDCTSWQSRGATLLSCWHSLTYNSWNTLVIKVVTHLSFSIAI